MNPRWCVSRRLNEVVDVTPMGRGYVTRRPKLGRIISRIPLSFLYTLWYFLFAARYRVDYYAQSYVLFVETSVESALMRTT